MRRRRFLLLLSILGLLYGVWMLPVKIGRLKRIRVMIHLALEA